MKFEEFAKWVAEQIFDENVDDDVFCELACRKLSELGLVEKTDTDWIFISTDKEIEKPTSELVKNIVGFDANLMPKLPEYKETEKSKSMAEDLHDFLMND